MERNINPNKEESLEELLDWYNNVYISQLVNGSNISMARMVTNLAILNDAISSYKSWRNTNGKS